MVTISDRIGRVAVSHVQGASPKGIAPLSTGAFNTRLGIRNLRFERRQWRSTMAKKERPTANTVAVTPRRPACNRELLETYLRDAVTAPVPKAMQRRLAKLGLPAWLTDRGLL